MNLPEALSREVSRVTQILVHSQELPPSSGMFLVMECQGALERAHQAAGNNDILVQMAALEDLKSFNE